MFFVSYFLTATLFLKCEKLIDIKMASSKCIWLVNISYKSFIIIIIIITIIIIIIIIITAK